MEREDSEGDSERAWESEGTSLKSYLYIHRNPSPQLVRWCLRTTRLAGRTNEKGGRFPFRPLFAAYAACYLNSDFWYSRFSLAMNLTLIPLGHAAWHS